MQKSIIVATVISLYSVENFPKNSLRSPLLLGSLEYHHFEIYLLLSPDLPTVIWDLPTVVSRFTYCHLWIYLSLFPDLPTVAVSWFTYHCLRIYLALSHLYLPSGLDFSNKFFTNPTTYMAITFLFSPLIASADSCSFFFLSLIYPPYFHLHLISCDLSI